MIATRIYNSVNEPTPDLLRRHKTKSRCSKRPIVKVNIEERLRKDIVKYKTANNKIKTLAKWNLRSTRAALKDIEEMLEVIEDLYGEDTYE